MEEAAGAIEVAVAESTTFTHEITYYDVIMTDYYRRGQPYALLGDPGHSAAVINFNAESLDHVILALKHCRTNCDGVIQIYVNGKTFLEEYKDARWDNFGWDEFHIPGDLLSEGHNRVKILLHEESPGVYWLSDVTVTCRR